MNTEAYHRLSMAHSSIGKPDLRAKRLSIAKDFSRTPGGRYRIQGPNSGEQFRQEVLQPKFKQAVREGEFLIVDLDGGYGYASSFLEEAFGGLVREEEKDLGSKAKALALVRSTVQFISEEEPYQIADLERYILEACDK